MKGKAETLSLLAPAFSAFGFLASLLGSHWLVCCIPVVAMVAAMVWSRLTYRKRWRLLDESTAWHKGQAEAARARFLANVRIADPATLQAMIGDASMPEELRQELREQLARRRGGLN